MQISKAVTDALRKIQNAALRVKSAGGIGKRARIMKKSISVFLAVLMFASLITVSAFADYNPDNHCDYGIEYGEVPMVRKTDSAGMTIYVAGNVFNCKTFPLSSAPAMNNTFTYEDIVFSNYIEHNIVESVDVNGNPITVCQVSIGLNGAMRSNVSNVEFMSFVGGG